MIGNKMAAEKVKVEPTTHSRYSLRESSKVPSRYRDYVEESTFPQQHVHAGSGMAPPASAYPSPGSQIIPIRRPRGSEIVLTPRKLHQQQSQPTQQQQPSRATGVPPPPPKLLREQPAEPIEETTAEEPQPQQQQRRVIAIQQREQSQQQDDRMRSVIGAEQEVSTSGYVNTVADIKPPPVSRPVFRYPPFPHSGRYVAGADLSDELKINLRKLKNVLKLPKARRFVFCEFFYSGVDQQLFLAENEFSQLMHESFPNLKCTRLKKPEWREIRRLIGKPRRCSQAFLNEEREALEAKRQKIRAIYNGSCSSLDNDLIDLPTVLPRPPIVGQKIYARVRAPKDGIYAATVDAVTEDGYRLVFDKDDQLPASYIKDYEVMFDQPTELLSLNYFMEQNRTAIRRAKSVGGPPISHFYPTPSGFVPVMDGSKGVVESAMANLQQQAKKVVIPKDEKVGNFPVRMLVILVKLYKVIEYKKKLVGHLTMMNDCAERMTLLGAKYPEEFKIQFSKLIIDLETVNKLFRNYLAALQTHYNTLLPHLNEPQPTDRPEVFRKTCNTHAFQIVKHCNSELNVHSKRILRLITSLSSIMLQLRSIGAQKRKFTAFDMNILSESLMQIRSQIMPQNAAAFQDHVEVQLRQMLRMMMMKP